MDRRMKTLSVLIRGLIFTLLTRYADSALMLTTTSMTVTIPELAVDGTAVGSTFTTSGQPVTALYYYTLETITPNPGAGNEPFQLNQGIASDTNVATIVVKNPPGLDFETVSQWTLEVIVEDLFDPTAGTATTILTVDVTNESDPPTFLNLPGSGTVRELVTSPEVVKLVSVSDDENPTDSSGISIDIINTIPTGGPFDITSTVHNVPTVGVAVFTIENTANPGLDYESGITTWTLEIEAMDANSQTTIAFLTVDVLDENEPVYIANLPDTQVVGETMFGQIFVVQTIDVDVNDTTLPTFTMSPGGVPFTIDALGNIEVVPPGLNYMIQNSYTLTVTIDDGTFTDTQDLYVQVRDENAGPIILNLPDTISITEDSLGGNVFFTLSPYDIDGDTAICTFSPNPNDGNFDFNSTTYEIGLVTAPSLDAETTSSYEITVVCNDGMIIGPSAKLTVNVTAVNEPPVILNLPATVTVPEDAFNAAGIFLVDGYDVDGDEVNFTISVSPTSGQSKFSVADVALFDDGQIRIVNNPNFDYETVNQYIIIVEASDGIYTATGTLNVDITDVNEPPVFDVNPQDLYMNENTAIDSNLPVDLSVTDTDDAPADLTFAVVSSTYSGFFKVVQTPKLRVRAEMNYEDGYPEPFTIQVSVTDSAGNSDYLTVNVYLVNLNDNEPVFTLDPYTVEVKENWPGGMTVLTVTATDDDGDNIEYDIDPYSPYIEVDRNTGDVRLKQSLDRETLGRTIQVTVTATDDGTTPLQGISYINITIKDVNDNQPVFSKEFYDWEIRYDADLGTYINSVTAGDADKGTNAALTYSLLMDHVYFDMDDIGKVSVADGLKAETTYVLFCRAEDSGTPSETSDIAVIRVDAFIPQLVLINVHLGITVGAFDATERTQLLNTLNAIYAPWEFRISAVKSEDVVTSSSRRLLSSNAVLEMYALKNDATEDINNLNLPKEFIYVDALVNSMTKDSEGTPTDVLGSTDIVLVDPTYPSEVVITDINWWLDTLEGRITTGVLSALAFILLLLLLIICCWKCCCHRLAGCCRRCCHRKEKVDLIDERTSGWELRPKEEPVLEKRRMVIETPPPSPEMMEVYNGPQKPHHKPADEAPPGGNGLGGKFDFRYAGRPHPGGPQTLKAKDRPTLILPSSPTSPQSTNNATNKPFSKPSMVKKNTPTLQRRTGGGRVSPVVSASDEKDTDNRFDGSRYDNVTGRTYNFNTTTGEGRWDASPRISRRDRSDNNLDV